MDSSAPDLAAVFREHQDELLGFLRQQLRSPEQAEEIGQDVYLRLSRTDAADRIGNLRAYLYRIARNLIVDLHRRRSTEDALFAPQIAAEEMPCPAPTPEAAFAGMQDLATLRTALAELPAPQRRALLWYRLDGLNLREIGERLGVSESMACRYVNRALAHCEARVRSKPR